MKKIIFSCLFLLLANCTYLFAQTNTITLIPPKENTEEKNIVSESNPAQINKMLYVLKFINFKTEQDALVVDRILSQCENIISSKTDFNTGISEVIAGSSITEETIKQYLLKSKYIFELVTLKTIN